MCLIKNFDIHIFLEIKVLYMNLLNMHVHENINFDYKILEFMTVQQQ